MVSKFGPLEIDDLVMKAIEEMGFEEPTPVQIEAIPLAQQGRDLIAQAQTGTGKTAAFGIPIIESIPQGERCPSAIIIAPTRELAIQVAAEMNRLAKYKKVRAIPIYGGQSINIQIDELEKGVDIVAGTPGRLLDHLNRRTMDLRRIRMVVLDEADRMLDMGFIEDIEAIMSYISKDRQTMLFSATMPAEVKRLAYDYMDDPVEVIVSEDELVLPLTKQIYFNVGRKNKMWALCRVIDKEKPKAIIFCQTKRMVDILVDKLKSYGYPAEAIHGDMTQAKRESVLSDFKKDRIKLLIATDVAARGLDIEDVNYVINYDIPDNPEGYVHRIGRTGRAGKEGTAITFVTYEEEHLLRAIEQFTDSEVEEMSVPKGKGRDTIRKVIDYDQISDIFGMVRFEINLGKADGTNVNDIIGLLMRNTRIVEFAIGRVDVGEESTVFEAHKDFAWKIVRDLPKKKYNGKQLRIVALEKKD
jgi:ATP-dependent RNA helicase DeaD